ncbi:MAG TPA: adenylate/guanylate cyclase domain-containing protein [Acidimicrobiia bacterium]|nr:adenylate/guanylate cyclase domain-containing protein [Acidimicrobiia bacterium]
MVELPSGTVTFLFTDLEGSTRLWEVHRDAMQRALARHDEILREAITTHGGQVVKGTGDGVHAVFVTAIDAVDAAVAVQVALEDEEWESTGPLRVRMGVHTGRAELRGDDYYGPAVNRAARLMSVAHGGQVLVSLATEELVRDELGAGVTLVDLGEHGLRDLSRPERVFQVVAPGLCSDFPALARLGALSGNLPVQASSFVGREEELIELGALLETARVVTLIGVGGVGKTRLALETAAEVRSRFGEGAWLCELAGVRDPDAVAEVVLSVFGVPAGGALSAMDTLVGFLAAKDLLLVLDNCEHLVRAVADLIAAIERACPGVRVLATSREGLRVAGEQLVVVAPLDTPETAAEFEEIRRCAAARLFVERARSAKTTFVLDETNAEAVARLCRRLDGVALAIELAAARVAVLTPAELADRLDQRFRVLTGGQRSAVERHQTLRATIDWSYDLLSDPERVLLDRLGVFVGGFSLGAAETVTAGGSVAGDEVFEFLAGLVDRCLVVADPVEDGTRYRLLETIRQYAQERLDAGGDSDRVRQRHARWYLEFVESTAPLTAGPDEILWAARATREADNIRAALAWALDTDDTDTALRFVALGDECVNLLVADVGGTGILGSAVHAALELPGAPEHPRYPPALVVAAWRAQMRGESDEALRYCEEALRAQERLGTPPSPNVPGIRAIVAMAAGEVAESLAFWQTAIGISRSNHDDLGAVWGLAAYVQALVLAGDEDAAVVAAEDALQLARTINNPETTARALASYATALGRRDPQRALDLVREAIDITAGIGQGREAATAISGVLIAGRNADRYHTLEFGARAITAAHWIGQRLLVGATMILVADALADTAPEDAAILYGAADTLTPHWHDWETGSTQQHQHAVAVLQHTLSEARRLELGAHGAHMSQDTAVHTALTAINRALERC